MSESTTTATEESEKDAESGSMTLPWHHVLESPTTEDNPELALAQFRQEWQREVQGSTHPSSQGSVEKVEPVVSNPVVDSGPIEEEKEIFQRARDFFLAGVRLEKHGDLHDAVREYQKAFSLVPDIDKQHYARVMSEAKAQRQSEPDSEDDDSETEDRSDPIGVKSTADSEDEDLGDLVERFSHVALSPQKVEFNTPVRQTHISDLPPELVINILKWVVTSQLDLRSLERFSESCRWFYLLARSEEIWRLVCLRTWDQLVDRPLAISWREHFLTQPRVRVSGCYIARSSYTRQGERGFQDNKNTRTWHLVRYCRFLRFFPGGRVAMITSADPPQNVVKTLALTACPPQGTLIGQYKVIKNRVFGIIKPIKVEPVISQYRRNRRRGSVMPTDLIPEQEFHFEMEIHGRNMHKLHWISYRALTLHKNGLKQWTDLDADHRDNYPPLIFSPVKSYAFESLGPLM